MTTSSQKRETRHEGGSLCLQPLGVSIPGEERQPPEHGGRLAEVGISPRERSQPSTTPPNPDMTDS